MCLLSYYPANVQPVAEELTRGARINDDGQGYAIVAGDRIIVGRGMDATCMIEEFVTMRKEFPKGPALFHSRYGTHGSRTIENVHPFYVAGSEQTVMAHNGIMPKSVQPGKNGLRSDTRIVAESFIGPFGGLYKSERRARFAQWMTSYNKVVVLSVDPRYKEHGYIINENSGSWSESGIWYSNDGYKAWRVNSYGDYGDYGDGSDVVYGKYGWTEKVGGMWRYTEYGLKRHAAVKTWWDDAEGKLPANRRSSSRTGELDCWNCDARIAETARACPMCGWCCTCLSVADECTCAPATYDGIESNIIGHRPMCDWCSEAIAWKACAEAMCVMYVCSACYGRHEHCDQDGAMFGPRGPMFSDTLTDDAVAFLQRVRADVEATRSSTDVEVYVPVEV